MRTVTRLKPLPHGQRAVSLQQPRKRIALTKSMEGVSLQQIEDVLLDRVKHVANLVIQLLQCFTCIRRRLCSELRDTRAKLYNSLRDLRAHFEVYVHFPSGACCEKIVKNALRIRHPPLQQTRHSQLLSSRDRSSNDAAAGSSGRAGRL